VEPGLLTTDVFCMLKFLSIRDFVIVSEMDREFAPGFTALTGETGAGKSVLIDALLLALGERGDASMVRGERAEITAEFDISAMAGLRSWLLDQELPCDEGVCLMRRLLDAGGRSRAFINGRSVTLQQMREAGEQLLNIHGQHAHQTLLHADEQRRLLDGYAGLQQQAGEVEQLYRDWQALRNRRITSSENSQAAEAERELLSFQRNELEALGFNAADWETLQADCSRLAHAASLLETAAFGIDILSEADTACLAQIGGLVARLRDGLNHDASLSEPLNLLESAQAELQEAVYSLRHYQQRLDADPMQLAEKEKQIQVIVDMGRKYRVLPEKLGDVLGQVVARLAELGSPEDLAELSCKEVAARQRYIDSAEKLSQARKLAADRFSAQISLAMQTLAMEGGRFEVVLLPLPEGGACGLETVEFRIAANPGSPLRSMAKVASGGELSRISLAIQVATSQVASVPTLIFDEVDSGIGGRVAEIVGLLLKQLGRDYQVLCVTHLPQVAAMADHQWQVSKAVKEGVTSSHIEVLNDEQRIEEIARMLGGVVITETTRIHAAEMLGLAA
jgi:DNA repair protein RecN (Recombination protein N)